VARLAAGLGMASQVQALVVAALIGPASVQDLAPVNP
jgi:hypothetical protein